MTQELVPPERFATFGQLLRHVRKRARLTLRELSIATGYSEGHLANLERDARRPDLAMVRARLLPALDLDDAPAWAARLLELAATATQPAPARAAVSPVSRPSLPQPHPLGAPAIDLLATKLFTPQPRTNGVPRLRLLMQLDRALTVPLTLVAAPAGAGKTTLLADWLTQLNIENEQLRPPADSGNSQFSMFNSQSNLAWLSLDAEDNDQATFVRYLIAACQQLAPHAGAAVLALLSQAQQLAPAELLRPLLNDLAALTGPSVIILDDCHTLTAPAVHATLLFFLEHLPPQLHLVLASREDPPLPLARMRARGALVELRSHDLRFTTAESTAFLRTTMALNLAPEHVAALESRTEGWAAGLQLAALALQDRPHDQLTSFIDAFAGSHRFIVDYLADEVIARQPRHIQTFLLETAILERLCGPLCDAVMLGETSGESSEEHTGSQAYSQAILEELERRNLFIIPLDDVRQWYRYHHLLAQVLRQRLMDGASREAVAPLHQRAAAWFEQHDLAVEAVHHALDSHDWERAARLITAHGRKLMVRGQVHTVREWLNKLPDTLASEYPYLHTLHAIRLFFENQHQEAERHLQAAEASLSAPRSDEQSGGISGYAMVLRASIARFRGDLARGVTLASQALAILPTTDVSGRMVAQAHAALTYEISGELGPNNQGRLLEAVVLASTADELGNLLFATVNLAEFQQRQGRLRQAAQTYREAAELLPDPIRLQVFPNGANYYFGLGNLLYERNDLDSAEALLQQGQAIVRAMRVAEAQAIVLGYYTLARLQQARGDSNAARSILDELQDVARQRNFAPQMIAQAAAARAQLALLQGNSSAAVQWADTSGLGANDDLNYLREQEYLMLARVRIAQDRRNTAGSVLPDILRLLDRLLAAAETSERIGSVIEINVLRALAFQAQGTSVRALQCLERALQLAGPESYVRVFIDEGAPMAELLEDMDAQGVMPAYVRTLLAAFPGSDSEMAPGAALRPQPLAEPLSERELEVLRMVAAGYANRAIALALTIEVGTVKRHIHSLLGKLDAPSRTAAVARARTLGLL